MFHSASLVSFLLVALSLYGLQVSATPLVNSNKLSFAARINITGFPNIVAADQARAKALKDGLANSSGNGKRSSSFPVTNTAVGYTANVGVGSPPTYYNLIIDTGSSNTWVGASKAYVKTSTSQSTGKTVSVSYGSGSFSGTEYVDTVALSSSLVITGQSIGVASSSTGFSNVDGILGIGPVDLTSGTLSGTSPVPSTVPTVTDNLFTQKTISTEVIGIYFDPTSSESDTNGELTFGGVDTSKTTSSVNYVPITSTSPASEYWGIDQSVTYGDVPILIDTAGIVDTGTTLILIDTISYAAYVLVTGGTPDSSTGLLKITSSQYSKLETLNFKIGGTTYPLSPNGQIWPRALNAVIGGTSDGIYLVVANTGSLPGQGLDCINGYTFLERFYSVFDTTNKRVGFATTAETNSDSN